MPEVYGGRCHRLLAPFATSVVGHLSRQRVGPPLYLKAQACLVGPASRGTAPPPRVPRSEVIAMERMRPIICLPTLPVARSTPLDVAFGSEGVVAQPCLAYGLPGGFFQAPCARRRRCSRRRIQATACRADLLLQRLDNAKRHTRHPSLFRPVAGWSFEIELIAGRYVAAGGSCDRPNVDVARTRLLSCCVYWSVRAHRLG